MKLCYLFAMLLGASLFATACVHAPYGMSVDRHNYGSTIQQPKRVALRDATDGSTIWSINVPVGQTLVVDLARDARWTQSELTGAEPAHTMRWGLFETGRVFGSLQEKIELSGNPVILDVQIREVEQEEIREASYTPVEEPPLPEQELERAPEGDAPPPPAEEDAETIDVE